MNLQKLQINKVKKLRKPDIKFLQQFKKNVTCYHIRHNLFHMSVCNTGFYVVDLNEKTILKIR